MSESGEGALLLELRFDASALRADVERLLTDEWTAHFNTAVYAGGWRGIALRGPAGATHPILALTAPPGHRDWADTPVLARCPSLSAALARFCCSLHSVRLLRLAPGARIHEHDDPDLDLESGPVRVHVPIVTNEGVRFMIGGERYDMAAGETWCMDGSQPHSVENAGTTARIHLVLDCEMNAWLRDQLADARSHREAR